MVQINSIGSEDDGRITVCQLLKICVLRCTRGPTLFKGAKFMRLWLLILMGARSLWACFNGSSISWLRCTISSSFSFSRQKMSYPSGLLSMASSVALPPLHLSLSNMVEPWANPDNHLQTGCDNGTPTSTACPPESEVLSAVTIMLLFVAVVIHSLSCQVTN